MKYTSLNEHLLNTYGQKLYKLSLNAGLSCPNRDGTVGKNGCIFCSAQGSGDFAPDVSYTIGQQIELAKIKVQRKAKCDKFIAYFQSFTNTYGPIPYLEKIFMEAIQHPDIEILSIATRPDCLSPPILELLGRLKQIKPVWVELGLQTIHEETAQFINRGYPLYVYDKAVKDLKKLGIEVIVHVILGLPHETSKQILETVDYVCNSGIQGIKLQLLHVLKNTKLAEYYEEGLFATLTMEEYLDLLEMCIKKIPSSVVIHRLTGDGPKSLLIAPLWSQNKKLVINAINQRFSS